MSTPTAHLVIAIDGPAASGKSSVALLLAQRLGFLYVNSGAMYRAVTWETLRRNIPPDNAARIAAEIGSFDIQCGIAGSESTTTIGGVDPTPHLRDANVNAAVSAVSSVPEVRRVLVGKQRAYAMHYDLVMEGRDIGSVVFPETPHKFYIDASPEIRARRRAKQGEDDSVQLRDRFDSTRRASPLVISEDAHVIDSSNLTIDGVVGEIVGRLKLQGLKID